jgi:hypothetical protein
VGGIGQGTADILQPLKKFCWFVHYNSLSAKVGGQDGRAPLRRGILFHSLAANKDLGKAPPGFIQMQSLLLSLG